MMKPEEQALLKRAVDAIAAHPGSHGVRSIILTGSLSRGEGTYLRDASGHVALRSDIEVAVVYTGSGRAIRSLLSDVKAGLDAPFNLMPLQERRVHHAHNFNHQLWRPRFATLLTVDLYRTGLTLWGEDLLSRHAADAFALDPYEARRMVANRIGEWACLTGLHDDSLLLQWQSKLALALVRGWMVLQGCCPSGDLEVLSASRRMDGELSACFSPPFVKFYRQACLYLRQGGDAPDGADELLREAVARFDRLCRDRGVLRSRTTCLSRKVKYVIRALRSARVLPGPFLECRIIDGLMQAYASRSDDLCQYAALWKKILY